MTAIEHIPAPTLDELAATARREQELARAATESVVEHAILCGEAILEAHSRCDQGAWLAWIELAGLGRSNAYRFMRIARYKDQIPRCTDLSVGGALRVLDADPDRTSLALGADRRAIDAETKANAKEMLAMGESADVTAKALGLARGTVLALADPEWWERQKAQRRAHNRRMKEARKALDRQERDVAMKKAGGARAKAYGFLRECVDALQRAIEEAPDAESREALRQAMSLAHKAEDQIVAARR